jgi:hypothetical protein
LKLGFGRFFRRACNWFWNSTENKSNGDKGSQQGLSCSSTALTPGRMAKSEMHLVTEMPETIEASEMASE